MLVLVTGGTGYIGSHTVVELLNAGHEVVIIDNLCNSSSGVLPRIEMLTGSKVTFVEGDINDRALLESIFNRYRIDAVVHFAGLKVPKTSRDEPLNYYHNNISGTVNLLQVMQSFGCKQMVFSSSANVYDNRQSPPFKETMALCATNPYGRSKQMLEHILQDVAASDKDWRITSLRYCNPIGAHPSGIIGEVPQEFPANLLPYVAKVASGQLPYVNVFGDDYDTVDGTGVRDFVHVVDLALGHVCALAKLPQLPGFVAINLGSGEGVSVMQLIKAFERVCGKTIPFKVAPRREGDIAAFWADASLAKSLLNWQAQRGLEQMLKDAWHWQMNNPQGY